MKAFSIRLTAAEAELLDDEFVRAEECGDCTVDVQRLNFSDYEGVARVERRVRDFQAVEAKSRRQVKTAQGVRDKINRGIVRATRSL